MIEILSAVSRQYPWLRGLGITLALLSSAGFIYSLLGDEGADQYLIPSVITFIWALLLVVLSVTFPNLPPKPTREHKFLDRVKLRVRRLIFYTIGITFIALTIASISFSFKLFGVWRAEYLTSAVTEASVV